MVRASLTSGGTRHCLAHAGQASSSAIAWSKRDPVDLAQLLGEQVGAEEPLVQLLDAGELELLALGEVPHVLPQREPGALQLLGQERAAGRATRPAPAVRHRRSVPAGIPAGEAGWRGADAYARGGTGS